MNATNNAPRTSQTHPLQIASIEFPGGGRIGLTFCPGKKDPHAMTGVWNRDLNTDVRAIRDWGASTLITLMESHELEQLDVSDLGDTARRSGLEWHHLPIRDVSIPDERFESRWPGIRQQLVESLARGESVVIHCKGGLGRTGLVAGLLLVETGTPPTEALASVRAVRPGAVETVAQECYLLR